VAAAIDARFRPSRSRPHPARKGLLRPAARELIDLIGFTRWIGLGAVLAVLGLIGNAVLLVVRAP
jgi:putative ABC transport system permease protein